MATAAFFGLFVGPLFRRREQPLWHVGLAAGLAAFAIQNLADFTAFFPSLLWLAAMLRGLLVRPGVPGASPSRSCWSTSLRVTTLTATLAAAGIVALGGLAWNAKYAVRVAVAAGDRAAATESARRAVGLAPWDVDARLALAQSILLANDPGAGGPSDTAGALAHVSRRDRVRG